LLVTKGDQGNATKPPRGWRRVRRSLSRIAAALLVLYVVGLGIAWYAQETFIFPRWLIPEDRWAGAVPRGIEVLELDLGDGDNGSDNRVPAWLFRGASPNAGLVVYLHGNGRVIDDCVEVCRLMQREGWNVLLPEYRGYGRAAGSPSQAAISQDVEAFVAQVQSMDTIDGPLVLYGRSIGSCFAATLAQRLQADGLVLQTPPMGIEQMAARYFVPSVLIRNPLNSMNALAAMDRVPTLVIEHAQDALVPGAHAKRVCDVAQGEHVIVSGTHNACDDAAVAEAVERFLGERTVK
jgi:pimeloyl-ACP methyl ester carboxylesterase